MGKAYSYFNVWAISTIVYTTEEKLLAILERFEAEQIANNVERTQLNYEIRRLDFVKLLKEMEVHNSDLEIFMNFFRLLDSRGFQRLDIRDPLICFSITTINSLQRCFELPMQLLVRDGTTIIDKEQLYRILRLLNDTCYNFGDRYLDSDQVHDLTDSVYTSAGKIDGTIYYPHFIEYISTHPIVEMFVSPQFQGTIQEKLLDEEGIEKAVLKNK